MIKNGVITLSLAASIFLGACSMLPYKENFSCEKGKDNGMCGSVIEVYDLSSDMDELRKKTDREYEQKHPEVKAEAKTKAEQEARDSFRTLKLQEMVESVEIRKIQNETPTIFRYYLSEEEASNKADVALISENDKESKAIRKDLKNQTEKANSQTNKNIKNGKNTHLKHSNKSASKNDSKIKNNANKETNINKLYDGIKIYDNNESGIKDANLTNKEGNASSVNILDINFTKSNAEQNLSTANTNTNGIDKNSQVTNEPAIDCSASSDSKITQINGKVKVCVYHANIREMPSCKALVLRVANQGEELEALYEQGGWIKLKDGTYVHKSIVTKD
ncbi:SH3 domain-containing protein [Campylobacter jejuni]|nr:SH3 domain-containing protein [Campylobacter jejuni]ECH3617365.1 SH3 domain-containing protein [Campylobacter jejuni]EIC2464118.1 SH3 domain-containing protein [Campylobacter jejuni]